MADTLPPDADPATEWRLHTCLVGPDVGRDRDLTELLARDGTLTLVDDIDRLVRAPFLATVDVVVLHCGQRPDDVLALLPAVLARQPRLDIVVVDGGLTQPRIAAAFAAGARDYFPAAYDPALLAERIRGLSHARRRRRALEAPDA